MIVRRWRGMAMLLCGMLLASPLAAQEIKPFESGSLEKIVAAHKSRPFVLALWSLSCPHCQDELALLAEIAEKKPALDVVLVSTDTPEEAKAISAALKRHRLARAEAWVFADTFAERLRYEIDRGWRGELPRTYLYSADGTAEAVSGKLSPARLKQWIEKQMTLAQHP